MDKVTIKRKGDNPYTDVNQPLLDRIKSSEKRIEQQQSLVVFGFIVLLIMVATIVIMVVFEYIGSYRSLSDKIDKFSVQSQLKTEPQTHQPNQKIEPAQAKPQATTTKN